MPNQDAVNVLNDLIQTSQDGKMGFAEASKEATKSEVKTMFYQCSADCASAVIELQQLVKSLGGTPKESDTIAGAVHRGWTKVKATVGDANIGSLEELERAEDKAQAAYAKALSVKLPDQIRSVVQRQHAGAVRNHDLVRDLRNRFKATKEARAH